jgi:hypothetical protein
MTVAYSSLTFASKATDGTMTVSVGETIAAALSASNPKKK